MPAGPTPAPAYCPRCGAAFTQRKPPRTYCGKPCADAAQSIWRPDTKLKAAILAAIRSRRISGTVAALEIGMKPSTLRQSLRRAGSHFQLPQLERVATWLGISTDEAARLQGGTSEEEWRERMRRARTSPKQIEHLERLKTDRRYQRAMLGPAHEATRGKSFTADHRAKISVALKEYRQRPDAHNLSQHKKTLRGRAQTLLIQLRYRHPDWTAAQIEAEGIRRLMLPPFNVKTAEIATALLAPKLKPRPIRRRAMRHPYRCTLLQEMDAEYSRRPNSERAYGFMPEFERRLQEHEGAATPDHLTLKDWIADHEKRCHRHGRRRR